MKEHEQRRWAEAAELAAAMAAQRDALSVKLIAANDSMHAALRLVADLRRALGDDGKRMQPELLEYARQLVKDAARWQPISEGAKAVCDVAAERWTPAHDDEHRNGGMAVAAACYAVTEQALIAKWALQIEHLSERVADLEARIKKAILHMVCIGGPLNDNKLLYSKEQLLTFRRIKDELDE